MVNASTILTNQKLGIASVRAVTSNTLLLYVHNFSYGQLNGGAPQTLASISGTRLDLIVWTTM